MTDRKTDFVLRDATGVHWPGALPWRGPDSKQGYPTRAAAEERARVVRNAYAAKHGTGGPDLRAEERVR